MVTIVMGLQYGDEGKSRVISKLAKKYDLVIRSTGELNLHADAKHELKLLPKSILDRDIKSIISPGVIINLEILNKEIIALRDVGVKLNGRLFISEKAHIILPHYAKLDAIRDELKNNPRTINNLGISSAFAHKVQGVGFTVEDLLGNNNDIHSKIIENINSSFAMIKRFDIDIDVKDFIDPIDVFEWIIKQKKLIMPYIANTQHIINNSLISGENIIIEGMGPTGFDIDHGNYPEVSSSSHNASGSAAGAGIGPTYIDEVVGVIKAYTSRPDNGPFITELNNSVGNTLKKSNEVSNATSIRCGWLDLVQINQFKYINGVTSLCINHLDVVGKLDEIKICVAYKNKKTGEIITAIPNNFSKEFKNYEPVYKTFSGNFDVKDCQKFAELPASAQKYINFISEYTGLKINYIGTGEMMKDTIEIKGKSRIITKK